MPAVFWYLGSSVVLKRISVIEFEPRLLLRIGRSTPAVSFLFLIYLPTALGEVSTVIGGVRPFVFFYFLTNWSLTLIFCTCMQLAGNWKSRFQVTVGVGVSNVEQPVTFTVTRSVWLWSSVSFPVLLGRNACTKCKIAAYCCQRFVFCVSLCCVCACPLDITISWDKTDQPIEMPLLICT